jgi:hypothetical protein
MQPLASQVVGWTISLGGSEAHNDGVYILVFAHAIVGRVPSLGAADAHPGRSRPPIKGPVGPAVSAEAGNLKSRFLTALVRCHIPPLQVLRPGPRDPGLRVFGPRARDIAWAHPGGIAT